MQAHRESAEWDTFEIDYRIRVKAKDRQAAERSFLQVVCANRKEGLNYELVSKDGFQKVVLLPKENYVDPSTDIRVTKKEKGVT